MTATIEAPEISAHKVVAATQRIHELRAEVDAARERRNAAMLSLLLDHHQKPVHCYRAGGVSRNAFARLRTRAVEEAASQMAPTIPRHAYETIEDALDVIAETRAEIERKEAKIIGTRHERDDIIGPMLDGKVRKPTGQTYSNAEVVTLTGLTSARIAQIRQGGR